METSIDLISARITKLNGIITGNYDNLKKYDLLRRESLFDTLLTLYEECCIETLQKQDKQIAQFVDKNRSIIQELKRFRINLCDFDIKTCIGRGHYGQVHIVKEKQTGDVYAMKTVKKSECLDKQHFLIERDIMAFSESQWLTNLKYAFQDKMNLFYVMEYHPGGDLAGLLHRQGGTLPESAATFYLAELVMALRDLHEMGYMHRDIKPDNLLLDRCGHLKLIDFGSAAKIKLNGYVEDGFPVGTPDYIAPEVLESITNKQSNTYKYGASCDFWSVGILAYELIIGRVPFTGQTTSAIYAKIMNHKNYLKFPSDTLLTQAYISFVTNLLTDEKNRLTSKQIFEHSLFKNINFSNLHEQVPPFIPKVDSDDDSSNFSDISKKHSGPSIDNFKRKTQFSGRNLPFVGFTFIHNLNNDNDANSISTSKKFCSKQQQQQHEIVENLKKELENAKKTFLEKDEYEKNLMNLERKLEEKSLKLENIESIRQQLEKDIAASMAESTALKRTLEIERKDRSELERKALELIKSAKLKWEASERTKLESFRHEIEQYKIKINELQSTNKLLNEQLQNAFQIKNKHRESLRAVEKLNRKSVIGLESRLETVIIENEQTIKNLQEKLDKELKVKQELNKKIEDLNESKNVLQQQYNSTILNYNHLQTKIEEAENIIKTLGVRITEFENNTESIELYKNQIDHYKNELNQSQNIIKEYKQQIDIKTIENETLTKHQTEYNNLKETIKENKQKIIDLETKLHEEQEKNEKLLNEISRVQDIKNEEQELREIRTKLWRTEKDFSNCKIDKRILERELKDAQNTIKQLNDDINQLNKTIDEQKKQSNAIVLELGNINESLSLELITVKENLKHMKEKLDDANEKLGKEQVIIEEFRKMNMEKKTKIEELNNQIKNYQSQIRFLEDNKLTLRREKEQIIDELNKLKQHQQQLINELENSKRQTQNAQLNWEALKEACTLLEGQVIEFEKMNEALVAEKSQISENTEKLISDLCTAKKEIQEAKKQTNEEKSLRLLAESKIKRLNGEIDSLKSDCDSYKESSDKFKQYSNELAEQLTMNEERISEMELTIRGLERHTSDLKHEMRILKEDISSRITKEKEAICKIVKLEMKITELEQSNNNLMLLRDNLVEKLDNQLKLNQANKLKTDSIIQQQAKLIDYLHKKVDELSVKKKTLADKIFGKKEKENVNPHYKLLEAKLQKQEELNKMLKAEIETLKSGTNDNNCRNNNSNNRPRRTSSLDRQKSPKAFKRTTPPYDNVNLHRFQLKLSKQILKCQECSKHILLGYDVSTCLECDLIVHPECMPTVKNYCNPCNKNELETVIKDWIHILKNSKWEKYYCSLTNDSFDIFNNNRDKLIETIRLKTGGNDNNNRGKIILEPTTNEIGVVENNTTTNFDINLIMIVEFYQNNQSPINMILRFGSLSEKQKWYKAFQNIFTNNYVDDYDDNMKMILHINSIDKLKVNCIVELTKNIFVLGTNQGLFAKYNDNLLKIEGLTEVYRISILQKSKNVLMISNVKSTIICCDLNHLINLTQCSTVVKPQLNYDNIYINKIEGFHYLEVSKDQDIFCAATRKQLILVKFENVDNYSFRILDTAQPVSCCLFTAQNSVIVGSDKFFEIDLKHFNIEEFIDDSDYELSEIRKCYQLKSYPLGIMQIEETNQTKEYLICFSEIMIIVDEFGRFARHVSYTLKSVPLNFIYIHPYLYVIYFDSIDLVHFQQNHCRTINLGSCPNFSVIGKNSKGIYIYFNNTIRYLSPTSDESIVDDNDDDEDQNGTDLDQFSFTSSMVQSLDGHLSDQESQDDLCRRVKFTNL